MKRLAWQLPVSLAVATLVWAFFTWPVSMAPTRAIVSSAYNIEPHGGRTMIPGDHLQFLYHLWLAADTFRGNTPWFHNLYEFNTGDDADREESSTYYLPFSLFYALGESFGGHAAGWNFMQWVIIWLSYLFTWLLVQRHCPEPRLAGAVAVVAVLLPFRWITLLDGSPTGLAMMWVPILAWLIDILVAERRPWAALLAGLVVYFSGWSDSHVFFFTALAFPLFGWVSHAGHFRELWPVWRAWVSLFKASWPLLIAAILILVQALDIGGGLKDTRIARGGRSHAEVSAWSPSLDGLVRFENPADNRKIYLGLYLIVIWFTGWVAYLASYKRKRGHYPNLAVFLVLHVVLAAVILLASGTRNPFGDIWWTRLTRVIPPYAMIRQPDKIFCLMPTLLALGLATVASGLIPFVQVGRRQLALAVFLLPLLADYKYRIRPTACPLVAEQGAYAAVATHAQRAGDSRPHLLALPLWPGDSHFTSLNQYYVSLYRLRMVNGYRPTPRERYVTEIFERFEHMNTGLIEPADLDDLLARGVRYLVLHEDVFPEKVSPFPIGWTLEHLLNHPRLEKIGHDGAAWSFHIRPADAAGPAGALRLADPVLPARIRDFERYKGPGTVESKEPADCLGGAYLSLPLARAVTELQPLTARADPRLAWWIRGRGEGPMTAAITADADVTSTQVLEWEPDAWAWQRVPLVAEGPARKAIGLRCTGSGSKIELDAAILADAAWQSPSPGETVRLPAVAFFHAGYTADTFDHVVLRRDYDPAAIAFYGPKLPLNAGTYEIELVFETDAPPGTEVGRFNLRDAREQDGDWTPVVAGQPARGVYGRKDNRPVHMALDYYRAADLRIRETRITCRAPPSPSL